MKKVLVLVMMVFAVGCAKKYVKAPEEEVPGKEIEVVKEGISPDESRERVPISSDVLEESLYEFKDVLFDFDRYNIRPDAKEVLDSVAVWLNNHKDINVIIEGHCDERGTNEYNLALGEKRAKTAKNYLLSQGVTPRRMNTVTFGEEKPVCTGQYESCWQRNRRAHFVVAR